MLTKLFRTPALTRSQASQIMVEAGPRVGLPLHDKDLATEWCYYIAHDGPLTPTDLTRLRWLLAETFEPQRLTDRTLLTPWKTVLEVGPRLNFTTAWSSTAVGICHDCGIKEVTRIERAIRYGCDAALTPEQASAFLEPLHDRMTQMPYAEPLASFEIQRIPDPTRVIDVLSAEWRKNLLAFSEERGCGWDEQDLEFLRHLFQDVLRRNPTDVELFQLAQANSEHSRHGFFKGIHVIDGVRQSNTLMQIVKAPWKLNPNNSILAFCDDSSAIRGFTVTVLEPEHPGYPSRMVMKVRHRNPTVTAETHNHPTRISPRPGAETGIGGDIRDAEAIGRGGLCGMHGAGYAFGAIRIPGYNLPWEKDAWPHAPNGASPLRILIEGIAGVHGYGNCFGEPTTFGFVESVAITTPDGEHYAYQKPILYVTAAGTVDSAHLKKGEPEEGMLVVQIGGPAYRIGLGGGSGSSQIGGASQAQLDFDSVQRGDPQMEQRHYRVIQACVAMGEDNPIVSGHDLGAGGDCNALPEIVHPAGGRIDLRAIPSGDASLSELELWGNESQERMVILCREEDYVTIAGIAEREACPCVIVGRITGDGRLVVHDSQNDSDPVDLPLKEILGDLPPKRFQDNHIEQTLVPLELPKGLTVIGALDHVLRLPSVGSKQFITRNVDRSVRGLTPQQQCVGPNHLPLADYAVHADSYFGLTGSADSLGERPLVGLLDPAAMGRLVVSEALLNMVGARITKLEDVKGSYNWMVAAKFPGQDAWLHDAAQALSEVCQDIGIAGDGGKDSLSMAVKTQDPQGHPALVKSPGTLVFSAYATMQDITRRVTPDLKHPHSFLVHIDLSPGKRRLGGSALAQVFDQLGDEPPDLDDPRLLKRAFETLQKLIDDDLILSLHDVSSGGLIVTLLEMAFGGNLGLRIRLNEAMDDQTPLMAALFAEEPGVVIECADEDKVAAILRENNIPYAFLGHATADQQIEVYYGSRQQLVLDESMASLRNLWEATSFAIDRLQADPECVDSETKACRDLLIPPPYKLTFTPRATDRDILQAENKPRVAIIRLPGSNGDLEMAAAFLAAGFEPWDVTISDLQQGRTKLDGFRGVAFVGGFSYADVFDAAKGWAGVIRFDERLRAELERFRRRPDTFSFGVCNGCQLMALLGWVPGLDLPDEQQPRFIRNQSGRFESRFPALEIMDSPAIMLRGMAGSRLGVWSAHGEGRFRATKSVIERILDLRLAPLRYLAPYGTATETYPFNPNGSPCGIAGLCSPDGRHLALMPHPERTFLPWQWPWMPEDWKELDNSPWLRLFQNAFDWCRNH